ncbi:hypothetical protein TRFO_32158 [Tritrichomonas foetus]|uniref:phosphatidylinositol 3-kinase n=1 Tax=Tritrichomonas foetus TaxID=1144522 RepID=A0A1J4JRD6_9EUKA|nr:hypothetical protein TRFO_32158 [Tritrichomonas foetus]|eukprot:OHT00992.1 hypothetical protein TRFO_32158 [Tritrichomonas foetus]
MNSTEPMYTKDFKQNVLVELKSLTVDVAHEIFFDIYKYFKIEIPTSLIEDWDSDEQLPFNVEVECTLVSNNRPLTCPIVIQSEQHVVMNSSFPNISIMHNVMRQQHTFSCNSSLIELPIYYSELPVDSTLRFKFYACLFQAPRKYIGTVSHRLFTCNVKRLRTGPYILGFDEPKNKVKNDLLNDPKIDSNITSNIFNTVNSSNSLASLNSISSMNSMTSNSPTTTSTTNLPNPSISPNKNTTNLNRSIGGANSLNLNNVNKKHQSNLHKHVRRIITGKLPAYELFDDQVRIVAESLHPDDAVKYFISLYNPMKPPKLSDSEMFIEVNILSPAQSSSINVLYSECEVESIYSKISTNMFQLTKESNNIKIQKTFAQIRSMPPLADITSNYRSFIRTNYETCLNDPSLLSALFRSMNWSNEDDIKNLSDKLKDLPPVGLEYALEFFTSRFDHEPVRQYAVRCIASVPPETLQLYLPQLIQAVKVSYSDGLSDILVNHSKENVLFASKVYWTAHSDDDPKVNKLKNDLMSGVTEDVMVSLKSQRKLIDDIYALLDKSVGGKRVTTEIQSKLRANLAGDFAHLQHFAPVRLPLEPTLFTVGIDPVDIKVFQSKLCPVALKFLIADENNSVYRIIFKLGDDMRQDQLILQLFEVMDKIFQTTSMQLNITTYHIHAFTVKFGCCQFIDNSKAIYDIVNIDNQSILEYFEDDKGEKFGELPAKIDRYTRSLAAYLVMTYVLLVGDRHDNNIMVKKDGRLLHIDFGFILGEVTKPFTPPVKLRKGMLSPIGGDGLNKVMNFAGPAFNALRKQARLILTLIELMFDSKLPCFNENPKRKLQRVEQSLMLPLTDIEAMNALKALLLDSVNSKAMTVWDKVHEIAVSHAAGNV